MKNVGVIRINKRYLARVLGYKGGDIKDIKFLNEKGFEIIEILLEHPSLPEFNDGDYIPIVDECVVKEH